MAKLKMLKPRLQEIDLLKARGIKTLEQHARTLKQKQQANGRTLALNGAAWRKLRAYILNESPLCEHCMDRGLTVPATDVDHINNDPSDNRRENLQALCHECHSRKTNADMGHRVAYGCDADGMPLDPNHPWNREKSPATDSHEPPGSLRFNAKSEN